MRRTLLAPLLSALLLLACQMAAPNGGSTVVGDDAIAVTSLDAPGAAALAPQAGAVAPTLPAGVAALATQAPTPATPAAADAAAVARPATADTPRPQTRPQAAVADPNAPDLAAPAAPEAPKTAGQVLCEKSKGQWVGAGETGAFYCASTTRDGGKRCTRKSQCRGECLARSGSCAPIMPLYGCNDVLDKDGRMVTLCID